MKGLIIKDLLALKKQGKLFLGLFAFYFIYAIALKNISMLSMITVLCVMLPMTTMAYDERSKWDKYALSMPISRKTIVLSKYLFSILLDVLGVLIVAVTSTIIVYFSNEMEILEALFMAVLFGAISLLFLSVMLPILFKYGVEKARLLIIVIILIPVLFGALIPRLGLKPPSEEMFKLGANLSPVILIAILFLSIKLSINIFNKKEF